MSDPNKPKPLPPEDFSATTPNIKLPKNDAPNYGNAPTNDWEKTNYNYSAKDLGTDQWNKPTPQSPQIIQPSSPPKADEWGKTQANINIPFNQSNQSEQPARGDGGSDYGATTPFINLPKDVKEQYQGSGSPKFKFGDNTEEEKEEPKKKGGIPGWLFALAGLILMFFFAVIVMLAGYFFFLNKTGFEVVLKGAPPRSDILIDGSNWGVTSDDGTIRLQGLKSGETKKIEIKNPNFKCEAQDISGANGDKKEMLAKCTSTGSTTTKQPVGDAPKECFNLGPKEVEKSRKCANDELDKLEKAGSYTAEQLAFAMNLYIILFPVNKYEIVEPKDKAFIARAASFMKKLPPSLVIEVGGHTDPDGGDKKNIPLSENRATSVRNALVENGINSIMLRTKGYSSTQPRVANDSPENKFRNRRIQYTVISQ